MSCGQRLRLGNGKEGTEHREMGLGRQKGIRRLSLHQTSDIRVSREERDSVIDSRTIIRNSKDLSDSRKR